MSNKFHLLGICYCRRICISYDTCLGTEPKIKEQSEFESPPPIIDEYSMQTMDYVNTSHFILGCPESNLPDAVKDLLIGFIDEAFPLGIPQMKALIEAEELIETNMARISNGEKCEEGSSKAFYELIPFKGNYRRRCVLDNLVACNRQLTFVGKLQLNLTALLQAKELNTKMNPMDNYLSNWLNVGITLVDHASDEFRDFGCVVKNTQHPNGSRRFRLSEVFKVDTKHPFTTDTENHRYLFHYSFPSNMLGILREGLLVAPEHIHSVNRFLGKGIYFWCSIASPVLRYSSIDTFYFLVCRVALGQVKTLKYSQNEDDIVQLDGNDSGMQSGIAYTDVRKNEMKINNVPIFCGQMEDEDMDNWGEFAPGWGSYDKYIVPNENQCKIDYILKLDRISKHERSTLDDLQVPNKISKLA